MMTDKQLIQVLHEYAENGFTMCAVPMPQFAKYILNLISKLENKNTELEYKLLGVMHSVDKWLEGDELNQDEVNRAATMREKTLRIVEGLQSKIEK